MTLAAGSRLWPYGVRARTLEQKHREGYRRRPVRPREFSAWEAEQAWIKP